MFCCEDVQNCDEMFSTPGTFKKISPLTPGQGQTDPLTPGRLGQPHGRYQNCYISKGRHKETRRHRLERRGSTVQYSTRYSTVQYKVQYSTRYSTVQYSTRYSTGTGTGTGTVQ